MDDCSYVFHHVAFLLGILQINGLVTRNFLTRQNLTGLFRVKLVNKRLSLCFNVK